MAEYIEIRDQAAEINERIDHAFFELSVLESKTGGLERQYSELKTELIKVQAEQKSNLFGLRILTGISAVMWIILLILHFIN